VFSRGGAGAQASLGRRGARDVISEQVKRGYFVLSHWIDVVDEQGEPVITVTFRDAVDVKE
jgi:hypothetical protein